jgi:hypothetical protein
MVCLKKTVQEITVNVVFDVLEKFPEHGKKKPKVIGRGESDASY